MARRDHAERCSRTPGRVGSGNRRGGPFPFGLATRPGEAPRGARGRSDWHKYADLFTGPLLDLEAEAVRIRTYEVVLIPGLLQTPDYAAAVSRASQVVPPSQIDRKVESRTARRGVLDAPNGPRLTAAIDEPALRKVVASRAVLAEQLRFLVGMAAHYKVTMLVLPDEAGGHPAVDGAFALLISRARSPA